MMNAYWKDTAAILITVILGLFIGRTEKDISVLLSMAVCCMAAAAAISYLEPVLDLLHRMESLGDLQDGMLSILLKAVGIALAAELAGMVCQDAGNGSLAKVLQTLGSAAVLSLSIPVFTHFLSLLEDIFHQVS